jgi:hypothetical protein
MADAVGFEPTAGFLHWVKSPVSSTTRVTHPINITIVRSLFKLPTAGDPQLVSHRLRPESADEKLYCFEPVTRYSSQYNFSVLRIGFEPMISLGENQVC